MSVKPHKQDSRHKLAEIAFSIYEACHRSHAIYGCVDGHLPDFSADGRSRSRIGPPANDRAFHSELRSDALHAASVQFPRSGRWRRRGAFPRRFQRRPLSHWASNAAKVTWNHRINSQWSTNVTFDLLWGFNGDQDVQDYLNANPYFGPGTPTSTVAGYTMPYGPTASLNLGVSYKITENQTLRLDAYNVLGWVDQNLNKEEVYDPTWAGVYRVNAPAFGVTYKYTF